MLDVLIIVSSDPRYDTRSSKFLASLTQAGYRTRVVGISSDRSADRSDSLVRVPVTSRGGKQFFFDFFRKIFPEAARTPSKVLIAGDLFSLLPTRFARLLSARKISNPKMIYDSKELYSELPSLKRKKSSFIFWNALERNSIRAVDSVITVNQSIAEILEARWHLPTTVVMNVPDSRMPGLNVRRTFDKIILAFSGGLQPNRGLANLIRMMSLLPERYELKIVGDGRLRSELEGQVRLLRLENRVHFVGRVRNSEVVNELSSCHLGIYLMENAGLCHYLALPNKLFQFISARLPVVVPNFPEMERIVKKYEIGLSVDPSSAEQAARVVTELTSNAERYNHLVDNCIRASMELNWQVEKEKFLKVVGGLIQ